MAKKIYLSPSSQWANKYSYGEYSEAEICGKIAESAREALIRNNYDVRVGSNKATYAQRVKESNEWGADVHMPIHTNAGKGDGTVVFCYRTSVNDKYVVCVYNHVSKLTPTNDDGIRVKDDLYEINKTNCVCVYLEVEFHDSVSLAKWIVENVTNIGEAIAKGICEADGKEFQEKVKTETEKKEPKYVVQAGAFSDYNNAKKQAEALRKAGFSAIIKDI